MIRYYAYYSVGGYKDMYLGNSGMNEPFTYYLPLLPIWEKKAEANKDYAEKLEACRPLPKIKIASVDDMLGLPDKAASYFVHGGYKELLSTLPGGETVLVIRDIESRQEDDSGRRIPFLFSFVADTHEDSRIVSQIAAYCAGNMDKLCAKLSEMLVYDPKYNGLRFSLAEMNKLVSKIKGTYPADIVTSRGIMPLNISRQGVHFISVPKGLTAEYVSKEIDEPLGKNVTFGLVNFYDASDEAMRSKALSEASARKRIRMIKQLGLIGAGVGTLTALLLWYLTNRN